jgi:hypothetical protein
MRALTRNLRRYEKVLLRACLTVTLLTLPLGQFSDLDSPIGCSDREDFLHLAWDCKACQLWIW